MCSCLSVLCFNFIFLTLDCFYQRYINFILHLISALSILNRYHSSPTNPISLPTPHIYPGSCIESTYLSTTISQPLLTPTFTSLLGPCIESAYLSGRMLAEAINNRLSKGEKKDYGLEPSQYFEVRLSFVSVYLTLYFPLCVYLIHLPCMAFFTSIKKILPKIFIFCILP